MPIFIAANPKKLRKDYTDLDGAVIIYPYVATDEWNSVFRMEAELKADLDEEALRDAVEKMQHLFPYYFSTLGVR